MKLALHTATVATDLQRGALGINRVTDLASDLGFCALEVEASVARHVGPGVLRRALDRASLAAIYASDDRLPGEGQDTRACAESIALAAALGADRMRVLPPAGTPRFDILEAAEGMRVRLLVENEPSRGSVLHVRHLVDETRTPWLRALYDVAAPALAGEDPVRSLYLLNERIGHVHLRDAKITGGAPYATSPGEGDVWLEGVFWGLWSLGYQEYLTLEFPGSGDDESRLRRAMERLRRLRRAHLVGLAQRPDGLAPWAHTPPA